MNGKRHQKLVHEGSYVAEVDIELIDTGGGWSPYLSPEDAEKLDADKLVCYILAKMRMLYNTLE